jgi:hypothetical protein
VGEGGEVARLEVEDPLELDQRQVELDRVGNDRPDCQ